MKGENPAVYGDGEQSRDFTYIANVVDANIRASEAKQGSGEVMNAANGDRISLLDLFCDACCSGFCDGTMGCEPGVCALGGPPCQACVPIVPGVCGSQCDSPPPPCPPGFVPASDGFCWTGFCIEGPLCGVVPPP